MLNDVDASRFKKVYLATGLSLRFFILIFSGNSHVSLSSLQKDEDNIFILNHRFVPFLLHHQATAVFNLLTFCRIPLLCASFPLKEPRKCG